MSTAAVVVVIVLCRGCRRSAADGDHDGGSHERPGVQLPGGGGQRFRQQRSKPALQQGGGDGTDGERGGRGSCGVGMKPAVHQGR